MTINHNNILKQENEKDKTRKKKHTVTRLRDQFKKK